MLFKIKWLSYLQIIYSSNILMCYGLFLMCIQLNIRFNMSGCDCRGIVVDPPVNFNLNMSHFCRNLSVFTKITWSILRHNGGLKCKILTKILGYFKCSIKTSHPTQILNHCQLASLLHQVQFHGCYQFLHHSGKPS